MRLEYWIIAIYMLFLIAMGYVQKKRNKNVDDYFRSGCQGTWWLVGASAFMSGISAYTFTAASGVAFEAGWSILIIYIANAVASFLAFLFLAPWFRQLRAITSADIINMRFGAYTQQIYAWITVLQYGILAGLPLYALALFCSAVFGLNIYMVIMVIGGIVIFYSTTGGKWAIMSNDFIQSIVLLAITILVAFLCFHKVGGISGFLELVHQRGLEQDFKLLAKPGDFPGNRFTWVWAVAILINANMANNTLIAAPKYFTVKDGREARKAALFVCVLGLAGCVLWFLPAMVARLLFEQQVNAVAITKPSEAAYAIVSMQLLPKSLIGLVVVAMFAATMSSLDTGINGNAAIIVRNIYPALAKLFRRKLLSERRQLILGEVCTVVMGIFITGFAMFFAYNKQEGIFDIMLNLIALLTFPLALPMLLCLLIRTVPSWSAIFTVIVCFAASTLGLLSETLFGQAWTFQQKIFVTLVAGTASFLATMPFWRFASDAYKEKVKYFFYLMHKPVDFEKEVGKSLDTEQFTTVGSFVFVLGLFVSFFLLLPNEPWGRACIVFVAGFVMTIGAVMVYFGRRGSK